MDMNASQELFLDTVIKHYNKNGLKFTIDDIAKSLKMSKRTIYELYGNKKTIISMAVDWVFHSIKKREHEIIDDGDLDILEKIRRVICIFPPLRVDFSRIEEIRVGFPEIYSRIIDNFQTNWDNTFDLVRSAVAAGRLKEIDLEAFRFTLSSVFEELLSYDESVQREKLGRSLDMILKGYIT